MPGVGHETRVKILSKYKSAEAFMDAPLEDIVDLLGKVRGTKLREQVAEYCAGGDSVEDSVPVEISDEQDNV